MSFEDFASAIFDDGGTMADVVRLENAAFEESFNLLVDYGMFDEDQEHTTIEKLKICKSVGRQFVIDNLHELFFLDAEKTEE